MKATKPPATVKPEDRVIPMATPAAWEIWLAKNHAKSTGTWLRIFKKNSGTKSITYAEAVDGALCHGWIDAQKKPYDTESWLQRFTPRRAKSIWSKTNTQHVERLTKSGKMKAAGLAAMTAAKQDGRWEAAYDSPKNLVIPPDFQRELSRNQRAGAFFATLNRANLYSIAWRLQTAKKPETRERRMKVILKMLAKGEKFHG
jgi:uncharacterized protein YdeI (YjbR/CyaY-like superfamily)